MKNFVVLLLLALFVACSQDRDERPTLEVGEELTNTNVRVIVIDTIKVEMTTFKFDSINSSASNRLLIGQYNDAYFGKVKASNYFELRATSYAVDDDAILDSVALILGYNGYHYNDTTKLSEIRVHLLTDDMKPEGDFFYNTSTVPFDPVPLATRLFYPEPIDEDSLHISLPIEFGQEIFNKIKENEINDDDDLLETLKGITLQPGSLDNAAIIGFSKNQASTYIRFFYSISGEFEDEELALDLGIPFTENNAFNNIQSDVSGTPLERLIDQEINLPSSESDDISYIQSGTGYATRIQFPSIKNLYDIEGTGTVLSAQLQIKPKTASINELFPIKDSLNVNIVDQNNIIVEQLTIGLDPIYGLINTQNSEFNEYFYQIPIGTYIDRKLSEIYAIDDAIILYPQRFNESVDRIILDNTKLDKLQAKLILTYAIYDE